MLQNKKHLLNSKNLLAFSAGVDSTALFFLLLEHKISFDIAIVDYGLRLESKEEVTYAKKLADKYKLKCHVLNAKKIDSNFEANARAVRYDFFESLIEEFTYENLLTAHHLGDRFEWMLMQFCKGAGCLELSGMKADEKRKNYRLLRPLLHLEKQELLEYLEKNNHHYFEDISNNDEKYTRNQFRHKYAKPLLEKYLSGIKKSFEYIDEDVSLLVKDIEVQSINEFAYFETTDSKRSDIVAIDKYLKSKAHLITASEKKLLASQETTVLGRKYVVYQGETYVFIAPYYDDKKKEKSMNKNFKEKMRRLKVEPKLRAYLAGDSEAVTFLSEVL
jgi:tRNA(Ile)-lysidine synthase